ncbi:serine hydrolase [Novosphingobium sp.]|uniref:serine hydrolase n=1 Tax=Novosphingobium sp. TaxID=1874826 RepID=UPI0035AE335A
MRIACAAILLALWHGVAGAETLAVADFEDGTTGGWTTRGHGDARLTDLAGNVSLRLSGGSVAVREFDVRGMRATYVQAKIAAGGLPAGAACLAEASRDGGAHWTLILRVDPSRGDESTLWSGGAAIAGDGDLLSVRLVSPEGAARCWFDDVRLSGVVEPRLDHFGLEQLRLGSGFDSPVDLSAFARPGTAATSELPLTGTLAIEAEPAQLGLRPVEVEDPSRPPISSLPAVSIGLVRDGDAVLPVTRGLLASDHPDWNWIFEPGQIWSEPGESGISRIALPFALQERSANCTHNGMLIFAVDTHGLIGQAAFEIASETCRYRKFDAWGFLNARFRYEPVAEAEAVAVRHRQRSAARLRVRPVEDLPGYSELASAAGPEPTVFGAVVGGIHYRSACLTRHGDYPACDEIDLPSYSTAKSIMAGVALMRLERLRPGVAALRVSDLVDACPGWGEVTLLNLLDMASGHYRSDGYETDEAALDAKAFFESEHHADRIAFACSHYPRKAAPGQRWVYRTSDTYILGTALAEIARREGLGDLYSGVVLPLWDRLQLSETLATTRRTSDAVGQAFAGYGLSFHPDDIVRIAVWLRSGADGQLDPFLLGAALQREPVGGGLAAGSPAYRYRAGFWARNIAPLMDCAAPVWVPFMSGFGGISVAMLPGDMIFYTFNDSDHYDWGRAVAGLRTVCP